MTSNHIRADIVYAWPTAEIAEMGPSGAANIIFKKDIEEASDPEAVRKEKNDEYTDKFANPYISAKKGFIHDIIEPSETRPRLISSLMALKNNSKIPPSKKHWNCPM